MFIETDFQDLASYKDPVALFDEGCVAVGENKEKANPITIGWGSIGVLWNRPMCCIYIHKTRYSKHIFDEGEFFSVCFFSKEYDREVDYFGTKSGREEDKIKNSHMTLLHEDGVPYLEEAELVFLCRKVGQTDFESAAVPKERIQPWYQKSGPHTIYCGEIIRIMKKVKQ